MKRGWKEMTTHMHFILGRSGYVQVVLFALTEERAGFWANVSVQKSVSDGKMFGDNEGTDLMCGVFFKCAVCREFCLSESVHYFWNVWKRGDDGEQTILEAINSNKRYANVVSAEEARLSYGL